MASRNKRVIAGAAPIPSASLSNPKIVLLGDSWVAQEIGSPTTYSAARGIFNNLNMRLGGLFEVVNIGAYSGDDLGVIRAAFSSDVLAYSPGFVYICGGINSVVAGDSAATMFADMQAMIDSAIENSIIPIVTPCQLTESGFVAGAANATEVQSRIDVATTYNRMLQDYSTTKDGWIYCSMAWDNITDQAFTDATHSVYMPAILSEYQINTGHPNEAGTFRIAKDIYNQIGHLFQTPNRLPTHYNDLSAGCHNPMQKASGTPSGGGVTGGAGITGTPPEGWYARVIGAGTGAVTVSQVARTDIAGAYWSRAVATNMQSGQSIEFRESETTAFNYDYLLFSDYGLAVGDKIQFTCEVKMHDVSDGAAGNGELNKFALYVYVNGAATTLAANQNGGSSSDVYVAADFADEVLTLSTPVYTIEAGATGWYCYVVAAAQTGAAGDTDFTLDLGRIGVRKVS